MNLKRHLLEAGTIVAAAVICALVANGLAARDRKMTVVGSYPKATEVPSRAAAVPPGSMRIDTPDNAVTAATPIDPMATSTLNSSAPTAMYATSTGSTTTSALPAGMTAANAPSASAQHAAAAAPATTNMKVAAATPKQPAAAPIVTPTPAPAAPSVPAAANARPTREQLLERFPPHEKQAYVEIGGDKTSALFQAGVLFLDARRTSVYEQGHIPGARSYSVWESDVDEKVNKLYEERSDPREQALLIVIYCSGGDCEDSHMLAQKLWGVQFNNVYVYKDGFPDWQKSGRPVKSGANP